MYAVEANTKETKVDITIEKGVSAGPPKRDPGRWQRILLKLDIGDSFVIDESKDPKQSQVRAIRQSAKSLGYQVVTALEGTSRRIERIG